MEEQEITDTEIKEESGGTSIIDRLIADGLVGKDQLQIAAEELKNDKTGNHNLLSILVKLGFISEATVVRLTNKGKEVPVVDLKSSFLNQEVVKKIPRTFAIQHRVIAIDETPDMVIIASDGLTNIVVEDRIRRFFEGKRVSVVHSKEDAILDAINKYYKYSLKLSDIIAEIESEEATAQGGADLSGEQRYSDPVVRLVDAIIMDAVRSEASDIHIEPDEYFVRIRCRIDGVMINRVSFHNKYWIRVLGRVKIMAGLNIAESRKPQDGAISMMINENKIDFRVSTIPTVHGENIVLRILDCNKSILPLSELGFNDSNARLIAMALERPEGIIIITGPTGSGKTTTLYSMIHSINSPDINIMTLEDPVEYSLPIIRQTAINHRAGMDFSTGLRAILRQDPDVIFIGEIRDLETADIAVKSSLTGHKVFSTLHTNNAIGAVYRLLDIGIKPLLMASSLNAIVAQRLVRKLCKECKVLKHTSPLFTEVINKYLQLEARAYVIYEPQGCQSCLYTGFKGRVATVEILYADQQIASMISSGASGIDILNLARNNGFIPMCEDGLTKVLEGLTSIGELRDNVDISEIIGGFKNHELMI